MHWPSPLPLSQRERGPRWRYEKPDICLLDAVFRILALTRKELLAVLKDPRGRGTILIPPILQCLLFGYAATYDLNDVPYAVLDQDQNAASADLLARLRRLGRVPPRGQPEPRSRSEDVDRLPAGALLVIQIGQDFQRRLLCGLPADVQVIADGRNSNTAGTATSYVGAIVEAFNADWRAAHGQGDPPVQVTTRTGTTPTWKPAGA